MSIRNFAVLFVSFFLCVATLSAQTVTGSITGVVEDPHGAIMPGVDVKLVSDSTGAIRQQTSGQGGEFTFNALPPDTYTLTVEHSGFKKYDKKNIVLNPNDHLSAGQIQLQIGEATESIEVTAEGASVQTASSERSGIITSEQVQDLTVINRDFSVLTSLQPGVVYTPGAEAQSFSGNSKFNVNGSRIGQNNITIDGVPIENSNTTGFNTFISMDAISQVKVQSSLYQAEFGRKSGAAVQAVTKAGTSQYHGELYWYQRNNVFDALQSLNKTNKLADPAYKFITAGGNIGGPIYIPKLIPRDQKKLFFFFSEEQQRESRPEPLVNVTVPTALERMGNFSLSGRDANGNPIPLAIGDPLKIKAGLACKKLGDPGCFPNGIIAPGEINPLTQAYLNLLPQPSPLLAGNTQFNFQESESLQVPKHNEVLRLDLNATPKTSFYTVLNRWWDDEKGFAVPAGNAAFGWMASEYNPIARTITISATHIFSPTLILENSIYGSRWTEGNHPSAALIATRSKPGTGLNFPQLDPQNNPLQILPQATFGGVNNPANPTITSRYPISGTEDIFSWTGALTKVHGPHTFKTGMYIEYWQQVKAPNGNFTGTLDFSSNNSQFTTALGNTGNPWANALVGDLNAYTESTTRPPLLSSYTGLEWFGQDNWKVTRKLTLDLGVRLGWSRPFHDKPGNEAGFVPELYNPAQQVALYGMPGFPTPPNSGLSGAIVPNPLTNPVNGSVVNGQIPGFPQAFAPNYPPGLRNSGHVTAAPRFGFAYDPWGDGKTAIRGGFGMFYDVRERDNFFTNIFKDVPIQFNPTIEFPTMASLAAGISSGSINAGIFPSNTNGFQRNRKVPYTMDYTFGIQREIGFKTTVDIAYVGSLARHTIWELNLNAVPAGATLVPANKSLPSAALRPYLGYTDIIQFEYAGSSNYNSLQVALNRRFAKSLDFGLAYTWSKALDFNDTDDSQVLNPLVFNNVNWRAWNYGRAGFDLTHVFKASWTWDIPKASHIWDNAFSRGLLDNWQISGITSYQTGAPMGITLNNICTFATKTLSQIAINQTCAQNGGTSSSGTAWSGSTTTTSRIIVAPGSANNVYSTLAHANGLNGIILIPPAQGTVSLGPKDYFTGPGLADWDMSLFKWIPLPGERNKLQFRAEVYDLFNHTNFTTVDTNAQFQIDSTGAFRQSSPTFGTYTGAQNKRRMQLALKWEF